MVGGLAAFLEGDSERVLDQLTGQMERAAEDLQFERAAQLRDQIRAARQIVERQKVVSGKQEDEDVIAFAQDERTGEACVQVFFIRRGKLIGRESFVLEGVPPAANGELISRLRQAVLRRSRICAAQHPLAERPRRAHDHRAMAARQAAAGRRST